MSNDRFRQSLRRREFAIFSGVSLSTALAGCAGILDRGDSESNGETTDESEPTDREEQSTGGEITSFEVTPKNSQQGEEITVTATISNTFDVDHTGNIGVYIGSELVFEDRLTVEAGEHETLTLTTEYWQTGTYDLEIILSGNDTEIDSARASVEIRSAHEEFVEVSGTDFVIDGAPVYYSGGHSGGNLHSRTASDDEGGWEYEYDDTFDGDHYVADFMQYAAANDMSVIRATASGVPWAEDSLVHEAPGEFNDDWFNLFDTIIAEAKRNNIRLVISTMAHDMDLAPAPGAYAKWSDTVDDNLDGDALYDAFFDDEQAKQYHKNFIEKLLTRENHITGIEYRNDPTVMMWECGNEINYRHPDRIGESLAHWYDETARYIKSLDENHLVGSGMYGVDARDEFITDHQVEAIDVCSIHLYPKYPNRSDIAEKPYEEDPAHDMSIDDTVDYIEGKVETAHNEIGKPIMLGEFNVPQFPDIYGWDLELRREFFEAMYNVAARTDLNGVNAFALTLDEKCTGEVRITNCRAENGIYPDDELLSIISGYGEVVEEKSDSSITE